MQDSLCPGWHTAPSHRELRLFPHNRPGFTVNSTRPQPVSRAAVPLIPLACSTGPPEAETTLHFLERSASRAGRQGQPDTLDPRRLRWSDERLGAACRLAAESQGETVLLAPTATTGHLLDGSPTSNLLRNCRTVRSHSPARRAHRTSRTQRTRRACRMPFAQAGIQHQRIGSCGSSRTTGPASL